MNFANFLERQRTKKNVPSIKDHYVMLGGEKKLDVSLRTFQLVARGEYPPSKGILAAVFDQLTGEDQKNCVLSFFRSYLGEQDAAGKLVDYVEESLSPGVEQEEKSIWESGEPHMTYSDEQLEFLYKNSDAMRLHKRVLLFDEVNIGEARLSEAKLEKLKELSLIRVEKGRILPSRLTYRLPNYENGSPRSVSHASDYILAHLNSYVSREGSAKQQMGYAMQNVKKDVAKTILEQTLNFKKWIQKKATQETGPDVVPILFFGFSKELENREI